MRLLVHLFSADQMPICANPIGTICLLCFLFKYLSKCLLNIGTVWATVVMELGKIEASWSRMALFLTLKDISELFEIYTIQHHLGHFYFHPMLIFSLFSLNLKAHDIWQAMLVLAL